jgi:hypothetical protein
MNLLDRPWRQRTVVSPLPTYLQPLCIHGPVRFDPTLRRAGEILQTRPVVNHALASGTADQLERDASAAHGRRGHPQREA